MGVPHCNFLYKSLMIILSLSVNMFFPDNFFTKCSNWILHVWRNITVEPIVAMYCLIIALSGIPGEELYLKKACRVNFNHSMEVCDNIYIHEEVQIETQKLVSGVQVYLIISYQSN